MRVGFKTLLFLVTYLCSCLVNQANEPVILGETIKKHRVKGKIVSKESWHPLPKELSHHMGDFRRLKVKGLKTDKVILSYFEKKNPSTPKKKTYTVNKDTGLFMNLDFRDIVSDVMKSPILKFSFYLEEKLIQIKEYKTVGEIR